VYIFIYVHVRLYVFSITQVGKCFYLVKSSAIMHAGLLSLARRGCGQRFLRYSCCYSDGTGVKILAIIASGNWSMFSQSCRIYQTAFWPLYLHFFVITYYTAVFFMDNIIKYTFITSHY
jgi:hypothetical protein